jgi:two-component system chemotaxis sensor kinase CheA
MGTSDPSESIIARFRTVGLERLEQIENIWTSLMDRSADATAGHELLRSLHTLKGEARILGFVDVHFVCHRLEELIAHANQVNYGVSEDFDLMVIMGVRFLAMLLRKKPGAALGGIDLPGFARQIDEVIRESQLEGRLEDPPRAPSPTPVRRALAGDRLSDPTLHALAIIATDLYVECLATGQRSCARLRASWTALTSMIESLASVHVTERVERQLLTAHALAADLQKEVEVASDMPQVLVREETAQALEVVMLHGIRNAVDHGVETPASRECAGKSARGNICVSLRCDPGELHLSISDDGCGIDRKAIERRVRQRGLMTREQASQASDEVMFALLFEAGFSTRSRVDSVSGRGVGLDAVRAAATALGGTARLESVLGRGTTLSVQLPHRSTEMDVYAFRASRAEIALAVPATWDVREAGGDVRSVDPLQVLNIGFDTHASNLLELRRGNEVHVIRARGPARPCTVERRCVTPDCHPIEVVWNRAVETLLLRPEILFATTSSD